MRRWWLLIGMVVLGAAWMVPTTGASGWQQWAHYDDPFTVPVGDNLGSDSAGQAWRTALNAAVTAWNVGPSGSTGSHAHFVVQPGSGPASSATIGCSAVGTVQVCHANYGNTKWVSRVQQAQGGSYAGQAYMQYVRIDLNDYYLGKLGVSGGKWYTNHSSAQGAVCWALGYAIGLSSGSDTSSCMAINGGSLPDQQDQQAVLAMYDTPTTAYCAGVGTAADIVCLQ